MSRCACCSLGSKPDMAAASAIALMLNDTLAVFDSLCERHRDEVSALFAVARARSHQPSDAKEGS